MPFWELPGGRGFPEMPDLQYWRHVGSSLTQQRVAMACEEQAADVTPPPGLFTRCITCIRKFMAVAQLIIDAESHQGLSSNWHNPVPELELTCLSENTRDLCVVDSGEAGYRGVHMVVGHTPC